MIGVAYVEGQEVLVDPGVFVASPTMNEHIEPCVVLESCGASYSQVYLSRKSNHDTLYVFKHRVTP